MPCTRCGAEHGVTAPAAARTRDPKLRRLVLYPTELPEQYSAPILPLDSPLGKLLFDKQSLCW